VPRRAHRRARALGKVVQVVDRRHAAAIRDVAARCREDRNPVRGWLRETTTM
jgi:hypothetical protein